MRISQDRRYLFVIWSTALRADRLHITDLQSNDLNSWDIPARGSIKSLYIHSSLEEENSTLLALCDTSHTGLGGFRFVKSKLLLDGTCLTCALI